MSDGRKLRILLVDDDKIARNTISQMLKALGYDVLSAGDGQEALDVFITADGFDLVLTDINMPLMDGWQLSLRLKAIKPKIPIIAITGENPGSIHTMLQGSGISFALFKPFNLALLRESLENIFQT